MPQLKPVSGVKMADEDPFSDYATDLYEWLSLVTLESPRIDIDDQIDPYLSRYSPPSPEVPDSDIIELVKVKWEGFISASWTHQILVKAILAASAKEWFCLSVMGFSKSVINSHDCTILKLPDSSKEYVLWEVDQS